MVVGAAAINSCVKMRNEKQKRNKPIQWVSDTSGRDVREKRKVKVYSAPAKFCCSERRALLRITPARHNPHIYS